MSMEEILKQMKDLLDQIIKNQNDQGPAAQAPQIATFVDNQGKKVADRKRSAEPKDQSSASKRPRINKKKITNEEKLKLENLKKLPGFNCENLPYRRDVEKFRGSNFDLKKKKKVSDMVFEYLPRLLLKLDPTYIQDNFIWKLRGNVFSGCGFLMEEYFPGLPKTCETCSILGNNVPYNVKHLFSIEHLRNVR